MNLGIVDARASVICAVRSHRSSSWWSLAVLMPVIAALGGNAGVQALTVTVRALAMREITRGNAPSVSAQGAAGRRLLNGIAVMFVGAPGRPGLVRRARSRAGVRRVGSSRPSRAAALSASAMPLLLDRLGFDPAIASSVFVTPTIGRVRLLRLPRPRRLAPALDEAVHGAVQLSLAQLRSRRDRRHDPRYGRRLRPGRDRAARRGDRPDQRVPARSVAAPGRARPARHHGRGGIRRRGPGLHRARHRHGGDLARVGLGRPQLRGALEPLRQPDPAQRQRTSRSNAICRS